MSGRCVACVAEFSACCWLLGARKVLGVNVSTFDFDKSCVRIFEIVPVAVPSALHYFFK